MISLRESAFFPSGTDVIDPQTHDTMAKVATALNSAHNPALEGHTDSIPIHNGRFRSNWELSAARSIAMMELLVGRFGVEERRMAIVGFADTAPETADDTPEGQRQEPPRGHRHPEPIRPWQP